MYEPARKYIYIFYFFISTHCIFQITPPLGSMIEDFHQKIYKEKMLKSSFMSTNVLLKQLIFDFPPSELSKIKCKSDYLGNEMPCLRRMDSGIGTFKRYIMTMKKKKPNNNRKMFQIKSPFSLCRQTAGPGFQQKTEPEAKVVLCRRVIKKGEQESEEEPRGQDGGIWGSTCDSVLFSGCTHLPGFQDHVILQ